MNTLDIQAKEWFDKANGNSYFSAIATIDWGLPTEKVVNIPFQYGYDETYLCATLSQLQKDGHLPNDAPIYTPSRYCRENGIALRHSKKVNCLKKDVENWRA